MNLLWVQCPSCSVDWTKNVRRSRITKGAYQSVRAFLNNALTRLQKKRAQRVQFIALAYPVAAGRPALALPADVAAERENYKGVRSSSRSGRSPGRGCKEVHYRAHATAWLARC
jgi:hypothetical protein